MVSSTSLILLLTLVGAVVAAGAVNYTRPGSSFVCDGAADCYCPPGSFCECANAGDCYCDMAATCTCANGGDCYCGGAAACTLKNGGNAFCAGKPHLDDMECYSLDLSLSSQVYCVPEAWNASSLPSNVFQLVGKGQKVWGCSSSHYYSIVMWATLPPVLLLVFTCYFRSIGCFIYRREKDRKKVQAELKARVEKTRTDPQRGIGMTAIEFEHNWQPKCIWVNKRRSAGLIVLMVIAMGIGMFLMLFNRWTAPWGLAVMYLFMAPGFLVMRDAFKAIRVLVFARGRRGPIRFVMVLDPVRGEVRVQENDLTDREKLRFVEQLAAIDDVMVARPFHGTDFGVLQENSTVRCVYLVRTDGSSFTSECLTFPTEDAAETACGKIANFLSCYHTAAIKGQARESLDEHRARVALREAYVSPAMDATFLPAIYEAPPLKGYRAARDTEWYGVGKGRGAYGTSVPMATLV